MIITVFNNYADLFLFHHYLLLRQKTENVNLLIQVFICSTSKPNGA